MSKTTETGWAYIIDPKERILQHKEIPLDFTEMKKIMGCDMGEIVQLGHGLVMVCDENARLLGRTFVGTLEGMRTAVCLLTDT